MRCTAVPHTGHGLRYRPCTAIPSRKAVTFSGKPLFASALRRSIHSRRTSCVALCRRAICSSESLCVVCTGESRARWRISSEYAFPIPLNSRGSVSERLSVWFSRSSASRKAASGASSTSIPPRSIARTASAPRTKCKDARFFVAASVRTSVPYGKSMAASPTLPGTLAPRSSHLRRPAIMRCRTRNRSPSSSSAMRLPMRWMRTTCLPVASEMGGSKVRSTNGEARRTAWIGWRKTRASSASMYAVMSGSSGTQLDQLEDVAVGVLEIARPAAGDVLGGAEGACTVALDQRAHLLQRAHADAEHRTAPVVAAPLEGGWVEDGVQCEVDSGAELQLDPGGRSRPLRQADHVAPEPARLFDVGHLQRHPGELVHGAAM